MHALLWFWLGTVVGSFAGVFFVALLQAARSNTDEEVSK